MESLAGKFEGLWGVNTAGKYWVLKLGQGMGRVQQSRLDFQREEEFILDLAKKLAS